jgi:isopentenyldiphosphate isomerase
MGIYVLLQKRSPEKDVNPDRYDVSAAGHVSQGGEFRHAAVRELKEELGIDITGNQLELIGLLNNVTKYGDINDNEMSAIYLCRENIDTDKLTLQSSEVSEVVWAEIDELLSVMKYNDFPNCISLDELAMIKKAVL